jgi:hypothetical protein
MPFVRASLCLCALLATAWPCLAAAKPAGDAVAAPGLPPPYVVLTPFAVAGQPSAGSGTLSASACPAAGAKPGAVMPALGPALLDAVTASLQHRLSKTMTVTVGTEADAVPAGALVVVGCITRAEAGDGAKRIVGAYMGASHLDAHVQILSRGAVGLEPLQTFDVKTRGGNLLPPLSPMGLAMRAATLSSKTLKANPPKLAYQIARKVFAAVFPGRDNESLDDDDD